jgi:SNF2 family DNA or RNA helicase
MASRLTKEESGLNLPPKRYKKARFPMTPEQADLYRQMRDDAVAWINGEAAEGLPLQAALDLACPSCNGTREVNDDGYIYPCPECCVEGVVDEQEGTPVVATMAMVRLLRLQQITCGYLPNPEDEENPIYVIPGENRRLNYACNIIEKRVRVNGVKVIVWARFTLDIDLILGELKKRGIHAVRYDGQVNDEGRSQAKALFKGTRPILEGGTLIGREDIPREEQADVWVANQSAGATGLTLTIAKTVIYYSNNFKLIDRLQSEDRAHRIGQTDEVEYIDMLADDTIDDKIIESHRNKLSIASQILGDRLKEWI